MTPALNNISAPWVKTQYGLIGIALILSAIPLRAADGLWRMPDGRLTDPPAGAKLTATSGVVSPGSEGSPAFAVPFEISAGETVSVSLTIAPLVSKADAGAEGQGGVILTILPNTSEKNINPNAAHRQIAIVGSEPATVKFAFRAKSKHPAGELLLVPTTSYFDRTLQLSGIAFENHGPDADPAALTTSAASYPGQEPDAAWRAEAAKKIDQHRKADLRILVTDRVGNPLPNIAISVNQLRHAYPFGTAIVSSRIVDAPRTFAPDSGMTREKWLADNARYREEILRNFNAAVTENDLKWPQWAYSNQTPGVYAQDWTLQALDWLHQRDFVVKGHTLVWGSWRFTPAWLRELEGNPEALQRAVLAHIRDIGDATAGLTQYWDVLNEPMSHRNIIELLGMKHVAEWFKTAREVLPGSRLVMNEFDLVGNGGSPKRRADFLAFYKELAELGAPIDVIGFQGHFWSERFTAPENVWKIIDEVHEASGLPLMISEFDMNIPNEQMQADYTRDFLTAWFAHPATEAFIMWGFWGGAHWMGDAGAMFRTDWSEKPNLTAYRNLVYRDWWTSESLTTDKDGAVTLRAFLGSHTIVAKPQEGIEVQRTVELGNMGNTLHIVMPQESSAP
jgi:GH35 family endo-1,4-beta-xylanase